MAEKGNHKKETKYLLRAKQYYAISVNHIKAKIDNRIVSVDYGNKYETVNLMINECSKCKRNTRLGTTGRERWSIGNYARDYYLTMTECTHINKNKSGKIRRIKFSVTLIGLVWFVGFYGISTFVGYLTPNPFLCKTVLFKTIQPGTSKGLIVKNTSISSYSVYSNNSV